jgi:glycosyltransferase involved in cell wall biosynthesis
MELLFAESSVSGWGTEQHFAALAMAMARRSHRVRCLISTGSPLEALLRDAGIPVILNRHHSRSSVDGRRLKLLLHQVSQRRPDWLITNDPRFYWPLILTGRLTGARTALFRHWEYMSRSLLSRRLIPHLADRFILVSQFQREHLRRDGVDVSSMQILYNPIDTHRLSPSAPARARVRAALGLSDSQAVIGYVGRMLRLKGIFTLLTASEQLLAAAPGSRMLWVGDGADLPELRARVAGSAQRELHVFHGWTEDIQGIYNALDVLVVPSQYPEPFGRVSIEAQACGTAVVCSDAGGLSETISPDVSGLLVRGGSIEQLSAAILELTRNPDRRRAMAHAGRQFACSNFSFEHVALNFEAVLADKQYTQRILDTAAAL